MMMMKVLLLLLLLLLMVIPQRFGFLYDHAVVFVCR